MVDRDMESFVVFVLNIGDTLISCGWMFVVVHVKYMHDHLIDNLFLAISLGLEGSIFGKLGVEQ
jgi:hypothetical protein